MARLRRPQNLLIERAGLQAALQAEKQWADSWRAFAAKKGIDVSRLTNLEVQLADTESYAAEARFSGTHSAATSVHPQLIPLCCLQAACVLSSPSAQLLYFGLCLFHWCEQLILILIFPQVEERASQEVVRLYGEIEKQSWAVERCKMLEARAPPTPSHSLPLSTAASFA